MADGGDQQDHSDNGQGERVSANTPDLDLQSREEGGCYQGEAGEPGHQREALAHAEIRDEEAANVEQEPTRKLDALPGRGKRLQDREIPEDDLEKLRRVAHE